MNKQQLQITAFFLCIFTALCFSSNSDTAFTGKLVSLTASQKLLETSPADIANYLKEITSLKKHGTTDQTLSFVNKDTRSSLIEEVRIEFGNISQTTQPKWKFRYFICKVGVTDENGLNEFVNRFNKHFGEKGEKHVLDDETNYSWNIAKYFSLVLAKSKKKSNKLTIEISSIDSGD